MNLVLIDRNIVSDIRKHNAGQRNHNFELAQSVDKKKNFISPLMSIIEGRFRNPQSYTKMHDTLVDESAEISKFYKHARTDSEFLKSNSIQMISVFSEQSAADVAKYAPFVKFLQEKLADPVAEEKSLIVQKEILEYAIDNFYCPGHPVTICGLSCLHGNSAAHRVLKPKVYSSDEIESAAYNSLLDILITNQLAYIGSFQNKADNVIFLTRDIGLKNFLSQFRVAVKKRNFDRSADQEVVAYTAPLNIDLFPNLKKNTKKYDLLIEAIEIAERKTLIANPRLTSIARSIGAAGRKLF